jgi:hypothetical protein
MERLYGWEISLVSVENNLSSPAMNAAKRRKLLLRLAFVVIYGKTNSSRDKAALRNDNLIGGLFTVR